MEALRSSLIPSGMTMTTGYPLAAPSIAVAMPVLPVEASRITIPGRSSPRSSARATAWRSTRSLRLALGVINSSLPHRLCGPMATLPSRSSGVIPAASIMLSAMPRRDVHSTMPIPSLVTRPRLYAQKGLRSFHDELFNVCGRDALFVESLGVQPHRLRRQRVVGLSRIAHHHTVIKADVVHNLLGELEVDVGPHRRDRAVAELPDPPQAHHLLEKVDVHPRRHAKIRVGDEDLLHAPVSRRPHQNADLPEREVGGPQDRVMFRDQLQHHHGLVNNLAIFDRRYRVAPEKAAPARLRVVAPPGAVPPRVGRRIQGDRRVGR